MTHWLIENIIGVLGIIVGGFIAYHVYFLSKRFDLKDKLLQKEDIRKQVEPILHEIGKGRNSDVELVNVKKYFTHYPFNNEKNRHGYTYLKGELKAFRFDGVEFFCGVREVYKKSDGRLTLKSIDGSTRENFNILEVGVIPYEWIEYVDSHGDEFSYRPQFYTSFIGRNKSPYKYIVYYRKSDMYQKDNDPIDMKWRMVDVEQD